MKIPLAFPSNLKTLSKLTEDSNIDFLHHLGGIQGIATALETDLVSGIRDDENDLCSRHEFYGSNLFAVKNNNYSSAAVTSMRSYFCKLTLDAFKETTFILLLCCATLSVILGIKTNGKQEGIQDGVILFCAIFIVFYISLIVKFCKNRMLKKKQLSKKQSAIEVLRGGKTKQVAESEIVVGDIVCLTNGSRVPADGLLFHGENDLKLDDDESIYGEEFPFVFSGSKVTSGSCKMLVNSVGENTERSKMMKLIIQVEDTEEEESKFQLAVDKVAFRLEKLWLSVSLIVLVVQVLLCFACGKRCKEISHDQQNPKEVKSSMEEIMNEMTRIIKKQGGRNVNNNGFVFMLYMLVFSIREGLPLGIFLCFAYASRKMTMSKTTRHAKIRKLPASATIGLVTTICLGTTADDLALHHSKMADLWIGLDKVDASREHLDAEVVNKLCESIGLNSWRPTEDHALLCWAQQVLGMDINELGHNCTVIHKEPFDIADKGQTRLLLLRRNGESGKIVVHMHCRGAPELVLPMCNLYYNKHGCVEYLDEQIKNNMLKKIIENVVSDQSLQCIVFAHKQVEVLNNEGECSQLQVLNKQVLELENNYNGLILLGIVGLKNPYAQELKQAIEDCQESIGVKIKLMVSDDTIKARLMATNSGILKLEDDTQGAVVEASEFRNSSAEIRAKMIDKMRVLANATPLDKLLMVKCLKEKGEVVAVSGSHTRDSPLLKEADVGFSLSNEISSEPLKEDSDIVILDKNFTTFIDILKSGRYVIHSIQKFIQIELTLNIAAFIINLIASLSFSDDKVPLEPFKLLWVNMITDVLGALALAVSVPAESHSKSLPVLNSTIVTKSMWKNIIVQVVYQVIVFVIMQFKGKDFLHEDETVLETMIFSTFLMCQAFVLINAREIDQSNVFEGITKPESRLFVVMVGAIVILHLAAIEITILFNHREKVLDLQNWFVCIGLSALSLPIGCAAKWIPFN